ncbi:MAG TPA: aromatic acid exporter family protein [Anaerolineaceae bacterium]|nr:aromatic acid exporter family protein [Anaerolineaceae bacterium]
MQENTVWKRFTSFLISNSPGMRVIKTFLAITICLIIEHFRGTSMPYHSSIAAIVCMQPTLKSTFKTAGDRTIGTLIAGLYSFLFITIFHQQLQMRSDSLGYYVLIGVMTLPLMMLIIALKKQGGLAITVVVFILIVISAGETSPLNYTIERVVGTLIGIGVALFINWLPILNKIGKHLGHVDISPVGAASSNLEIAMPELTGKHQVNGK